MPSQHDLCFLMTCSDLTETFISGRATLFFLISTASASAASCVTKTNNIGAKLSPFLTPHPCGNFDLCFPTFASTSKFVCASLPSQSNQKAYQKSSIFPQWLYVVLSHMLWLSTRTLPTHHDPFTSYLVRRISTQKTHLGIQVSE